MSLSGTVQSSFYALSHLFLLMTVSHSCHQYVSYLVPICPEQDYFSLIKSWPRAAQYSFCFVNFSLCVSVLWPPVLFRVPPQHQRGRRKPSRVSHFCWGQLFAGMCDLGAEEPFGSRWNEWLDWKWDPFSQPWVLASEAAVSNPSPLWALSRLLYFLGALFYSYIGKKYKRHQLWTKWDNSGRPALRRLSVSKSLWSQCWSLLESWSPLAELLRKATCGPCFPWTGRKCTSSPPTLFLSLSLLFPPSVLSSSCLSAFFLLFPFYF